MEQKKAEIDLVGFLVVVVFISFVCGFGFRMGWRLADAILGAEDED